MSTEPKFTCEFCGETFDGARRAPIELVDVCFPCAKGDLTQPIPVESMRDVVEGRLR